MNRVLEILRLVECGASISEISRTLKVDRKTVRGYVHRGSELSLSYKEASELSEVELRERFDIGSPGPRSAVLIDFCYCDKELKKPGVTRQLLYEELLRQHPQMLCYSRFCAHLKRWQEQQKVHFRRDYKAGERLEVDFAGQTVPIYDERTGEISYRAQVFVATLCASNLLYVEASADQTLSSWLGLHTRTLSYIGGVPQSIAPDNLKSGVNNSCLYDPEVNKCYAEWAQHYDVAIFPARPKEPRDKAKVEAAVGLVERQMLARLRNQRFTSLPALNGALRALLEQLQDKPMRAYGCSRRSLFEEIERNHLRPLPVHPFVFRSWKSATVHIDYHVALEGIFYSVPYKYAHQRVELRYTDTTLEVFHKNTRIALHPRSYKKNSYHTLKDHMPIAHRHVASWSPERFLGWAETIGEETKKQIGFILSQHEVPQQAYRKCLGLLSCAKKFGPQRLELACKRANQLGIVSSRSIRDMLKAQLETLQQQLLKEEETLFAHTNIRGDIAFH